MSNCKKGDMCLVIRGPDEHRGKVCKALYSFQYEGELCWAVDPEPIPGHGYADSVLRPLRDSDEPDETLAWAGKPQEVKA